MTGPSHRPRGRRRINLAPDVVAALRSHLAANAHLDSEFFFSAEGGTQLRNSNFVRRDWHPLLKRAGLPRTKFHTLRHTAATLMLSNATHPKVVQETLGHSSIEMTMDVYSSVIPGTGREAANKLADLLAVPALAGVTSKN